MLFSFHICSLFLSFCLIFFLTFSRHLPPRKAEYPNRLTTASIFEKIWWNTLTYYQISQVTCITLSSNYLHDMAVMQKSIKAESVFSRRSTCLLSPSSFHTWRHKFKGMRLATSYVFPFVNKLHENTKANNEFNPIISPFSVAKVWYTVVYSLFGLWPLKRRQSLLATYCGWFKQRDLFPL